MENTPIVNRWRWLKWTLLAIGLLAICVLLRCGGLEVLVEIPLTLAFGWPWYLRKVLPNVHPDPIAIATAVACLLGVIFGLHRFLGWLYAARGTPPEVRRWPWKWTLQSVGLVVLMFVAGVAMTGIVHQTTWVVRSPEPLTKGSMRYVVARYQSANNLKFIGVASDHYASANTDRLPRSQFDAGGRGHHSWQTVLLPYIEQDTLYRRIDMSKPWTHPSNATAMSFDVETFRNPTVQHERVNGYGASHYAGNYEVVLSDTPRSFNSFPLGSSNTILAGEVSSNFQAWGDPLNARDPRLGANGHPNGFGSPNGRPQFLMLDGSVRTFDPKELADLAHGKIPE